MLAASAGSATRYVKPRRLRRVPGQSNEKSFGAADVAEPIYVLALDHFAADKFCAVLAESRERMSCQDSVSQECRADVGTRTNNCPRAV
jgi:hypothetical protein